MKKCLALLFMAILSAAGISIASSEYDWVMVRDRDGIQIYLKEFWADEIKAFKGVAQIEASVDSLLAVITDIKACASWIHHCKNQELLLRQSFSECYHYQLHHLPFPAQNRDFIFHTRIRRIPETGEINIKVQAIPEFCTSHAQLCKKLPRYSAIRVQHSHGTYHLKPLGKKLTRVTWVQHTNPGGYLPHWIINSLLRNVPFKTLQNLRKLANEEKYRNARMLFNIQGQISDIKLSPQ